MVWLLEHGLVEVVSFEPCDNCLEALPEGQTTELCVEVLLVGEKTDDRYQDKEFRFEATIEAIQCTNSTVLDYDWQYYCHN